MVDETNGKTVVEQPLNPKIYTINRNNVDITLKEGRTVRGAKPGKIVFDPDIADKQKFIEWIGLDNVIGILKGKVRGLSLGWAEEALDEESGELNDNKFMKFAAEFSASGETIGELQEQIEELQDQLINIPYSANLTDDQKMQFVNIGKKIQDLAIAINAKKRTKKADKEVVAAS